MLHRSKAPCVLEEKSWRDIDVYWRKMIRMALKAMENNLYHTRQLMIEQAHEIHLWMLRVYHISRDSFITFGMWLRKFYGRPVDS